MSNKLTALFGFALLLRLVFAPIVFHPDVVDTLNWGKSLYTDGFRNFYARDVPDAGPPNYPPIYFEIFYVSRYLYEQSKSFVWNVNLTIHAFPSRLYLWFESPNGQKTFNKLSAISADLGIAYTIYRLVKKLSDKKAAKYSATLFLILPSSWYISAVWGQTESVFILPFVLALYFFNQKRWVLTSVFYLVSLLIKPQAIVLMPLLVSIYLVLVGVRNIARSVFAGIILVIVTALPFLISLMPMAFVDLYRSNIREISGYLTANAFNFWGLFYGFSPKYDSMKILGQSAFSWGWTLYILLNLILITAFKKTPSVSSWNELNADNAKAVPSLAHMSSSFRGNSARESRENVIKKFTVHFRTHLFKRGSVEVFDLVKPDFKTLQGFEIASKNKGFVNILYLLTLSSMGAFLLLTRMHERYFYLPYVLLIILAGIDKKVRLIALLASLIFFVNLYHFWWFPKIPMMITLLSSRPTEIVLILFNFYVFMKLYTRFNELEGGS